MSDSGYQCAVCDDFLPSNDWQFWEPYETRPGRMYLNCYEDEWGGKWYVRCRKCRFALSVFRRVVRPRITY